MTKLLVFLGGALVVIFTTLYSGYVFSWLWLWFAVPLGAPPIGVALAIGLRLLIVQVPASSSKSDPDYDFAEAATKSLILTTMLWAIGFIASFFI